MASAMAIKNTSCHCKQGKYPPTHTHIYYSYKDKERKRQFQDGNFTSSSDLDNHKKKILDIIKELQWNGNFKR